MVTRAAIGPLYAVSYLEDVGKKMQAAMSAFVDRAEATGGSDKCVACGKVPETKKRCSRCQKTIYCSRACQTGDWKSHKKVCKV